MGKCTVSFIKEGIQVSVEPGTTVLEAQRMAGLDPNAPCGGQGTCGKCKVNLITKAGKTCVKACQEKITEDLTVETLTGESDHAILAQGISRKLPLDPVLRVVTVTIPKMELGKSFSQWERLKMAIEDSVGEKLPHLKYDLKLASDLYELLRQGDTWQVVLGRNRILSMTRETPQVYTAAVDIGTTTVVGYLMDGRTGQILATESRINPQSQYGADVIMRSNYALEHGVSYLSDCIRGCLQEILDALAGDQKISRGDIYLVSIVGNTCMHHLLLGLSPNSLSHAPYNPVIRQLLTLDAKDLDLTIQERGQVILLPNIAGFVGADTMGCMLSTRPDQDDQISLMIDIGTNGEMVMGSRKALVTCSTAAGPAFEGAKIECGMRGAKGAVDHVKYENGTWSYTTVGGEKAVGICGSGLIDLVAAMRQAGLIDESGYLELEDGGNRFVLVPESESGNGKPVYLSQKDIREVQLAKAAIAAGITLLRQELNLQEDQIDKVYIAGAFGNYMDPASACRIGLIPMGLKEKIIPIGNAAGEGAKIALLNRDQLKAAAALSESIGFVELATSPDFQDCFVDELEFPEL